MKSQWLVRLGQWMGIILCWVFAGTFSVEAAVPAEKYPTAAHFPAFLEKIRAKAMTYVADLPDFTCIQITHRRERRMWQASEWVPLQTLKAEVSYLEGKEQYRLLRPAGSDSPAEMEKQLGTVSRGEFGTILEQIFAPGSRTVFKLEGKDERRKRETVLLSFLIRKENSQYRLSYREGSLLNQSITTAWGGKIWVDLGSHAVVCIASEALNLPLEFPFSSAKTVVAYDLIPVGDTQSWLPVRAEFSTTTANLPEMSARMRSKERKNVIEFREYRKYSVEVKILNP
jgi:hypothetical protein